MRAPRAFACASDSRIIAAPPSERTNPLRSASNGREAVSGSGFFVSAVICENAATVKGWVAASEPPTMHRSRYPSRISRMPSPIAWFDEAQADSVAMLCPVSP